MLPWLRMFIPPVGVQVLWESLNIFNNEFLFHISDEFWERERERERQRQREREYTPTSLGQKEASLNINILMFNICRMHKKAEIVKNVSFRAFYKAHTVSHNATSLKIGRFLRESGDFLPVPFPPKKKAILVYCLLTQMVKSAATVRSNSCWQGRSTSDTEADRMNFKQEKQTDFNSNAQTDYHFW